MSQKTGIGWCHHTFNVVWGCTAISPGCDNCYAKTFAERLGLRLWGVNAPRRLFGDKHWDEPLKWNAAAQKAGERRRVFCSSMADVFDAHPEVMATLPRLWELIRATPHLDWLLLTKRHGRSERSLPKDWGTGYPNVWLGVSAENHIMAEHRIPVLLDIPAVVRWTSIEPMLGPIDLVDIVGRHELKKFGIETTQAVKSISGPPLLDWVVCGGESGTKFRPMPPWWAMDLKDQCARMGTAFFFKQASAKKNEQPIGISALDLAKAYPRICQAVAA